MIACDVSPVAMFLLLYILSFSFLYYCILYMVTRLDVFPFFSVFSKQIISFIFVHTFVFLCMVRVRFVHFSGCISVLLYFEFVVLLVFCIFVHR